MVNVTNCIDLYDIYITEVLKGKFENSIMNNKNFLYSPPELCFNFANESFGAEFLPMYNIYRIDPPQLTTDASSLVNYNINYPLYNLFDTTDESPLTDIQHLLCEFKYQIDFFANTMQEMNLSTIDFYKFRAAPSIEINLKDAGFDIDYLAEVKLEDPEQNHNLDEMFEKGRVFRQTYRANIRLLLFNVSTPITYSKFTFTFKEFKANEILLTYEYPEN